MDLFGTAATHTKLSDVQVFNLVINKVKHADKAITGSLTSSQEAKLGRTKHGPAQQYTTDEDRSYTSFCLSTIIVVRHARQLHSR
jgi:hypothetical protein